MKMKNKFVLGGFVLVAIASVILFLSFGVPMKGKKGLAYFQGSRQQVPRAYEVYVLTTNSYRVLIDYLLNDIRTQIRPLADCINTELDISTGIAIIVDITIENPMVFFYHNDAGLRHGGYFVRRETRGVGGRIEGWREERSTYWVGRPGHVIGSHDGYSWGSLADDTYGIECTFDTQVVVDVVNNCLNERGDLLGDKCSYFCRNRRWMGIIGS